MSDPCPYCSFHPTSMNDYCDDHRPDKEEPLYTQREVEQLQRDKAELLNLIEFYKNEDIHNIINRAVFEQRLDALLAKHKGGE